MAPTQKPTDDTSASTERAKRAARKERQDKQLDDALEATFPASDPPAIVAPSRRED